MSLRVISCHIMTYHVSLDFSENLSIKSGGSGEGGRVGQICLPRPLATASLSGRRQKHVRVNRTIEAAKPRGATNYLGCKSL
jgi:hypothetical protein